MKASENSQLCSCPYNNICKAEGDSLNVCAEVLGISFKTMYYCEKCQTNLCQFCISICREVHGESIACFDDEWLGNKGYFKCGGLR